MASGNRDYRSIVAARTNSRNGADYIGYNYIPGSGSNPPSIYRAPSNGPMIDYNGAVPQWRKRGVTFGWVKLSPTSRFQPAFIFPKETGQEKPQAQYIQTNGQLSSSTHPVEAIATDEQRDVAMRSQKSKVYVRALLKFNDFNQTKY